MSAKKKAVISIVINSLMTLITTAIIISYFFTENRIIQSKQEIFYFFTTDSNILACFGAIIVVIFDIQILRGKRTIIPKPAILFKFAGVCAVMLTMMTCLVYLAPKYGFGFIFGDTYFHVHLAAPLMAFISLCFFEKGERLGFWESQTAHLPFVIYGIVYCIMAIVIGEENGGWRDLYHFNENGLWLVSVILLTVLDIIIVVCSRLVYNIGIPKTIKKKK